VDTFEPEPEVDIDAVAGDLKSLAKKASKVQDRIAEYCQELGIEKPF